MRVRIILLTLGATILAALAITGPMAGRGWSALIDDLKAKGGALLSSTAATNTPIAKGTGGGTPQGAPAAVTLSRALAREIIEWDEYTGRFEAVESVDVRARVGGYLTEVLFKDGQLVRKGDLLYVIDPRPFERAVSLAEAELNSAKVRVENAKLDVERGRPLLDRKVISEKVFDDRANVQRDAEAAVKVAEAKLKAAELELSFTRITAPIAGRISRSLVTTGNLVSGGGSSTATSLTSIVSQDPIHLYFDISENEALKYKRIMASPTLAGMNALVALPDDTGFPHKGQLDFVDNRLDTGTGTLRARVLIENPSGLFAPGMFARVRLAGSPRHVALLLPDEAIAADQASRYVYVVGEDNIPQRRTVKLGPLVDGLRVVREGLSESDWAIVKGHQRVRPGQVVSPTRVPLKVSNIPPGAATETKQR